MRLKQVVIDNFGSYEHLEFDYSNLGLTSVQGLTGSGKSTLQDIPAWILYGVTSKNLLSDQVKNWSNLDKITKGVLTVQIQGRSATITRIRGKSTENDLYWTVMDDDHKFRGKDLADSQKLLTDFLGVTESVFFISSYYHEFNQSASFFTDKAKDRKEFFEELASLDKAVSLVETLQKHDKVISKAVKALENKKLSLNSELSSTKQAIKTSQLKKEAWDVENENFIRTLEKSLNEDKSALEIKTQELNKAYHEFTVEKEADMYALSTNIYRQKQYVQHNIEHHETCPTCGNKKNSEKYYTNELLKKQIQTLQNELQRVSDSTFEYDKKLSALDQTLTFETSLFNARHAKNPIISLVEDFQRKFTDLLHAEAECHDHLTGVQEQQHDIEQLYDIFLQFRNELLRNTVKTIETNTNLYLEKHFDAEIRVLFDLDGDGGIDVSIFKDGNVCYYKQLSKGQRQLLKLCFSVSCMRQASNKAGKHFSTLLFDEALDGLDTELKLKSLNLFKELELNHESILLIDHAPEIHTSLNKKFIVKLIDGKSIIEAINE